MKKGLKISLAAAGISAILVLSWFFYQKWSMARERAAQPNWYEGLFFEDKNMIFQFIRTIGYTYSGGADIGECIDAARRIKNDDVDAWYSEWKIAGERLYSTAEGMRRRGNNLSAKEAYLRASNYFRTAGFFMHDRANLGKAINTWKQSKRSFLNGIMGAGNVEQVKIPYENTYLPAYYLRAASGDSKAPLLIVNTGFDGTAEELYFSVGVAAVKRGYNCLLMEGPGQGEVIRLQKIPFRYDWEKVITPAIDYAASLPGVEKDKIAVMGISMGGYFAPRAAAFDDRIKACIANGGVFDVAEGVYGMLTPEEVSLLEKDPKAFDLAVEEVKKKNLGCKWFFDNGQWAFGAVSPSSLLTELKKYTLKDVASDIKCPVLVVNSQEDIFFKGQPEELYRHLKCPKEFMVFTKEDTAQAHCQAGATALSNERIFNWLDKTIR